MRASWVSRIVRWSAGVGLGLVRSVILLVVSCLYPAVVAVPVVLVLWIRSDGHIVAHAGRVSRSVEAFAMAEIILVSVAVVGALVGVLTLSGPIFRLLRWLVRRWTGTVVADGYRPTPPIVRMSTGFWWNGRGYFRSFRGARVNRWENRQLRDPAAWRERGLLLFGPVIGGIACFPFLGFAIGMLPFTMIHSPARLFGLLPMAMGIIGLRYAWRGAVHSLIDFLQRARATALSERVARLTEQRADATAAQAAELRRIERDLHDGAQARLVALGLALTTAERLVDRAPDRAKALLREATSATAVAVRELRELVRGIHPPVLSDRGLVDALRALALDTPLPVSVETEPDFDPRLDLPIESALYFGAAELLTNAVKHAKATHVTIRLCRRRDIVAIEVIDDGCGNATASTIGGLAGLGRRLAVFDGTLSLDSPAGGPTHATMVVPWTSP